MCGVVLYYEKTAKYGLRDLRTEIVEMSWRYRTLKIQKFLVFTYGAWYNIYITIGVIFLTEVHCHDQHKAL